MASPEWWDGHETFGGHHMAASEQVTALLRQIQAVQHTQTERQHMLDSCFAEKDRTQTQMTTLLEFVNSQQVELMRITAMQLQRNETIKHLQSLVAKDPPNCENTALSRKRAKPRKGLKDRLRQQRRSTMHTGGSKYFQCSDEPAHNTVPEVGCALSDLWEVVASNDGVDEHSLAKSWSSFKAKSGFSAANDAHNGAIEGCTVDNMSQNFSDKKTSCARDHKSLEHNSTKFAGDAHNRNTALSYGMSRIASNVGCRNVQVCAAEVEADIENHQSNPSTSTVELATTHLSAQDLTSQQDDAHKRIENLQSMLQDTRDQLVAAKLERDNVAELKAAFEKSQSDLASARTELAIAKAKSEFLTSQRHDALKHISESEKKIQETKNQLLRTSEKVAATMLSLECSQSELANVRIELASDSRNTEHLDDAHEHDAQLEQMLQGTTDKPLVAETECEKVASVEAGSESSQPDIVNALTELDAAGLSAEFLMFQWDYAQQRITELENMLQDATDKPVVEETESENVAAVEASSENSQSDIVNASAEFAAGGLSAEFLMFQWDYAQQRIAELENMLQDTTHKPVVAEAECEEVAPVEAALGAGFASSQSDIVKALAELAAAGQSAEFLMFQWDYAQQRIAELENMLEDGNTDETIASALGLSPTKPLDPIVGLCPLDHNLNIIGKILYVGHSRGMTDHEYERWDDSNGVHRWHGVASDEGDKEHDGEDEEWDDAEDEENDGKENREHNEEHAPIMPQIQEIIIGDVTGQVTVWLVDKDVVPESASGSIMHVHNALVLMAPVSGSEDWSGFIRLCVDSSGTTTIAVSEVGINDMSSIEYIEGFE